MLTLKSGLHDSLLHDKEHSCAGWRKNPSSTGGRIQLTRTKADT